MHQTTDRGSNQAGMSVIKFSAVFVSSWLCLLTATPLGPRLVPSSPTGQAVPATSAPRAGVYAADPAHLWNRVHRALYVRVDAKGQEYGLDDVDPLLWRETTFLLTDPSHSSAIRLLDEFLESGGERLIVDPLKRAVFQHDLWALFDWLAARLDHHPDARKALLSRVARVIRRVALTQDQIEGLPDNYQQAVRSKAFASSFDPAQRERAFLPPDLTGNGQWLAVSAIDPVAAAHASEISHSSFSVKWHVPGGAPATLAYWKALWDHPEPYVIEFDNDGERRVMVNPALPAIPSGTQLALVRRMLLIDQRGVIVPSTVTESVQLRVFQQQDQPSFEFRLGRARLFAGQAGGLQAVAAGDLAFFTFSSHGIDPFELPPDTARERPPKILEGCGNCHQQSRSSIHAVLSLRRLLKPYSQLDSSHPRWNRWFTQDAVAAGRKAQRADWGLLQGCWLSNPW